MRRQPLVAIAAVAAVLGVLFLTQGCTRAIPNRNPIGERFPTVTASSLEGGGTPVTLPDDFSPPYSPAGLGG